MHWIKNDQRSQNLLLVVLFTRDENTPVKKYLCCFIFSFVDAFQPLLNEIKYLLFGEEKKGLNKLCRGNIFAMGFIYMNCV